jgi:ATP-dependent DNA helicase RecG
MPTQPTFSSACADLGLVEKSGRGVDRIFWDQIRFCRPFPSYGDSTPETVRLTLEGGETSLEAVRWMMDHFQNVEELSIRLVHGAFLHQLFFEGELSRSELIAALPGLTEEVGRRGLTELINAGLVVRIDTDVASASFYRRNAKRDGTAGRFYSPDGHDG